MAWLRQLPGAVLAAGLLAWGGAEALLHWRGAWVPLAPPPPGVGPGPDKALAPADYGPAKGAELGPGKAAPAEPAPDASLAMPRVVTPDEAVRWGSALVTSGIRAVDGDSLLRGEERLRLIGIDAPELHQTCRDPSGGGAIACGRQAHAMLQALIRPGGISCSALGTDRYGRTLARCLNGRGEEVNRAMVLSGWALAADGDPTYAAAERQAAAAHRGMHALTFDRPSAWRRAHPR